MRNLKAVAEGLREIIDSVTATKTAAFKMVFDATLVRGMSYYTGTILPPPQAPPNCGMEISKIVPV